MNRMPVAERREQLIEAALAVASRDGIDAATVRAVAAEAGVSLGVVHYCFQDKAELMRAMAHAITQQNLPSGLDQIPPGAPVADVIHATVSGLWHAISEARGAQLLTYELTTSSLRQAELKEVAIEQYRGSWAAAAGVLEHVCAAAQVRFAIPIDDLARVVVAVVDGFSLAWLVDGDDVAALRGIEGFGAYLASLAIPLEPGAADSGSTDDDPSAAHSSVTPA
ncbi:TetR/AcrR family transcriptional regulator [Cellulomonas composti]|uniref:Putative transcriptional regulator, TetR family protein n=1 Tax=Cellulomonas composti TaxID=266130 RepID=A0A511JCM5_9CELL|nr:TetR family transcriptional regulator [Cellulomonas composti]GEL95751.1 putative transcriptional regulator, TetR family protein [Cellulomonas composti]